jgi:DNA-directed RNA polymerase I and III subunit RPAC1
VCRYTLVTHVLAVKIESESAYAPQDLLPEAIKVMREKIINLRKAAKTLLDRDLDVQMADPPS